MTLIDGLTNAGAGPVLEATLRFAGRRHQMIAGNIANIDTPGYLARDADPREFQRLLGEAIDSGRAKGSTIDGEAILARVGREVKGTSLLFHDQNDRDIERLMQDLAENAGMYRVASDLLRNHGDRIRAAIRDTR